MGRLHGRRGVIYHALLRRLRMPDHFSPNDATYNSVSQLKDATAKVGCASERSLHVSLCHHKERLEAAAEEIGSRCLVLPEIPRPATSICSEEEATARKSKG